MLNTAQGCSKHKPITLINFSIKFYPVQKIDSKGRKLFSLKTCGVKIAKSEII